MIQPGSIVRCRNRDWVVLPTANDEVWSLRPLTGTTDDAIELHRRLADAISTVFPFERVEPSQFPLPTATDVADATAVRMLWHAARLTLREGATPFRSLGRISIRPRTYQFVPLLMALRLDPVRLFIADDVGVGKTIEALLIARELLDRGEIRRVCVLAPPVLCDQWAHEMAEKFHMEPVVIRPGTVHQLERQAPDGMSIYEYFPFQVVSIDFAKTERNRAAFVRSCPEFVIVDEAHGAAAALGQNQQERHDFLTEIAANPNRHLVLLTATPHSGKDDAFRSLLGLLRPEFATWDISQLTERQRGVLARHFVQRTRADIERMWEEAPPFPRCEVVDATYELSPDYHEMFQRTYDVCSELVQTGRQLDEWKRRVRYWGALALLRCVMSSPAAAKVAIEKRGWNEDHPEGTGEVATVIGNEGPTELLPYVFEVADDRITDEMPTLPLVATETTISDADRHRLGTLATLAERLIGTEADTKVQQVTTLVRNLLRDGFAPIIWCRYIATAEYVAAYLQTQFPEVQVVCLTGRTPDDERQVRMAEFDADQPRVLVATDCLSEGVNLQSLFSAVIHYDLPWNPNRLEQREGRINRFGQQSPRVKVVRLFGRNNPVDGMVIEVLLRKATVIHQTLGIHVPVPADGESVLQAIIEAWLLRPRSPSAEQLAFEWYAPEVEALHHRWENEAKREQINRTRFAQRSLKPEVVQQELDATDAILGDPTAVQSFVLTVAQRLGIPITNDPKRADVWRIPFNPSHIETVIDSIRSNHPPSVPRTRWTISFVSPTPSGAEYVGRNHRLVTTLARFVFEMAMTNNKNEFAARCGAIRTRAVPEVTTLALLRVRYIFRQPDRTPLLAEEVMVVGWRGGGGQPLHWLAADEALRLLEEGTPDANLSLAEKQELVQWVLNQKDEWEPHLRDRLTQRAEQLIQSHKRIRKAIAERVRGFELTPHVPPDILGIIVLQPMVSP